MSRVIVKNLPTKVSEQRLRELFTRCGEVTDVKLVKTRSGVFRHFGFVGYVSDTQAEAAVNYFNGTFIDASKISVEVALPYGDASLTRPWSKYSKGSSAHQKWERNRREKEKTKGPFPEARREKERQQRVNQEQNKSRLTELLEDCYELEAGEQFHEFLSVHQHSSKVQTWTDEGGGKVERKEGKMLVKPKLVSVEAKRPGGKGILLTRTHLKFEDSNEESENVVNEEGEEGEEEEGEEEEEEGEEEEEEGERKGGEKDKATAKELSDMEYLRSKMKPDLPKQDVNEEGEEEGGDEEEDEVEEVEGGNLEKGKVNNELEGNTMATTPYTLKMRGLPFSASEEDICTFFYPINIASARFTSDLQGRPSGRAYVDFESEAELRSALRRNGDCIGSRYIELFKDVGPQPPKHPEAEVENPKPWEVRAGMSSGDSSSIESIAESGRLFVRNLSYTTTEEQLVKLFEKFGTLTEATIPLDSNTNRPTGFAFVTFMFPEHAVKAFEALDGQIFQGRLLHLLPAKPRGGQESFTVTTEEGSSYKKSKAKKMKSEASSTHNWNTLFLGANAVVDAMAERYSTDKSAILDTESGHSVAVRMALGETQLVSETREFLVANGVRLDLFEKKTKRSKTVILVKNLPFGTTEAELRNVFSAFKSLNRLILPSSGISALVEFTEPTYAKAAFHKLAYTKFKHLPLYLEWAPLGVLDGKVSTPTEEEERKDAEEDMEEDMEGEQSTVFVKNLNFSTDEESLREHFSRVGEIRSVSIARKRDVKDPSQPLSMGFGFVEFPTHQLSLKAIKDLQNSSLHGHQLHLKLSHRQTQAKPQRREKARQQKSAKILVRNIPFEASRKEVRELFRTFGELKTVRLPKKFSAQGEHRGFGFVEFLTKEDAKRAFEALAHSTHLYGRRLVLEWAEEGESVEAIRKRTGAHFHGFHMPLSKKMKAQALLDSLDQGTREEEREGE